MTSRNNKATTYALVDDSGDFIYVESDQIFTCQEAVDDLLANIKANSGKKTTLIRRVGNLTYEATRILAYGRPLFVCMFHQDISTEEHARLLELSRRNMELEAIFDASHDGIVVADAQGVYLRINKAYAGITGIPPAEIIGKSSHDIVDNGTVSDSPTYKVIETGKPHSMSQVFRSGRISHITASPVLNEKGQLFRVVVNIRDTTEVNTLRDALKSSKEEVNRYSQFVDSLMTGDDNMIFSSPTMRKLKSLAIRFAQVDAHMLIVGETGVGKEVITDLAQKHSARKDGPYVKINCSAIPEALLESQLFGYEEGAFTGAKKAGHVGLLEMADKGTAFLDEISEIPLSIQVKLLRFIQQKEFYRVGGKTLRKVDVRIIVATNRNLEQMVRENLFRADLFYRLNVLKLVIPSLRERAEDVIPLAQLFLRNCNLRYKMNKSLSPALLSLLEGYAWPGNVRELENMVERLVVVSTRDVITPGDLPRSLRPEPQNCCEDAMQVERSYRHARDQFERCYWQEALGRYGSCRQAAAAVGVDHSTVVKKVARYNLDNSGLKLLRVGGK
jgi:PAS domain S-box-containing protein